MPHEPEHSHAREDFREMALGLEEYRQIVETASDAVVTINQHHEVVYLNQAAERMFGYRREELLGGDLAPLIPREHRAHHRGYLERFLATGEPRRIGHSARVEAERRDGSPFPVSISFNVTVSPAGPLFTAIMRDLSTEDDLLRKMRDVEALAGVGRMVATVNHEIKTPLTLIGGFARQLTREPGLGDKGRHKLGIILEEVVRLQRILDEISDLTRPRKLELALEDVGALAGQVRELMAPAARKAKVHLRLTAAADLPPVMIDKNRLSQVLINLINNALQATPPGGEVRLLVDRGPVGGAFLEVRDTGAGIPRDRLNQVFTPFFTTKQGGTGLGLPVARRIVEEHGGSLLLASQEGRGTSVLVALPPPPPEAAAPGAAPPTVPPAP